MDKILVIADDFTGAGDTGAKLKKGGWDVQIVLDPEEAGQSSSLIIDTETRNLPSHEAYHRLQVILEKLECSCFECCFKKVDSILRGNICEELKAVKAEVKPDIMVFNPANPGVGRTVVNGIVQVDGVDLCRTDLSKDPLSPVRNDCVKSFLEQGLEESVAYITREEIKNKKGRLSNCRNFIFDAQTDADLEDAVRFFSDMNKKVLWVGSAGLAGAIACVFRKKRPVLCLIGSITEISRKQVYRMKEAGVKIIELDISQLLMEGMIERTLEEAIQSLQEGINVAVVSARTKEDYIKAVKIGKELGYTREETAKYTQNQFGKFAGKVLEQVKLKGLILSGGDTAVSVMKQLHVSSVKVLKEVMSSVPLCMMESGDYPGLFCITKSGSFGDENTLIEAIDYIRNT